MTDNDYRNSVLQRLDGIESWVKHNDETVERLDQRLNAVELKNAVAAEREQNVEKRLASIESGVKFIIFLFVTAFVTAAVAFVVSGGLAV